MSFREWCFMRGLRRTIWSFLQTGRWSPTISGHDFVSEYQGPGYVYVSHCGCGKVSVCWGHTPPPRPGLVPATEDVCIHKGDGLDPSFFGLPVEGVTRKADTDGEWVRLECATGGVVEVFTTKPLVWIEPERN
jgi:hypothetical protein